MCEIIAENAKRKAIVLQLDGIVYAVTKECLPKEEFKLLFPNSKDINWQHVKRHELLKNPEVFELVKKKKIGTINCDVRRLN